MFVYQFAYCIKACTWLFSNIAMLVYSARNIKLLYWHAATRSRSEWKRCWLLKKIIKQSHYSWVFCCRIMQGTEQNRTFSLFSQVHIQYSMRKRKEKTCISLIEVNKTGIRYIKKNKWSQGPGEVLYSININTCT